MEEAETYASDRFIILTVFHAFFAAYIVSVLLCRHHASTLFSHRYFAHYFRQKARAIPTSVTPAARLAATSKSEKSRSADAAFPPTRDPADEIGA